MHGFNNERETKLVQFIRFNYSIYLKVIIVTRSSVTLCLELTLEYASKAKKFKIRQAKRMLCLNILGHSTPKECGFILLTRA